MTSGSQHRKDICNENCRFQANDMNNNWNTQHVKMTAYYTVSKIQEKLTRYSEFIAFSFA